MLSDAVIYFWIPSDILGIRGSDTLAYFRIFSDTFAYSQILSNAPLLMHNRSAIAFGSLGGKRKVRIKRTIKDKSHNAGRRRRIPGGLGRPDSVNHQQQGDSLRFFY